LLALGSAVYSAGALVYASKRPNPARTVFGYHEVFHALAIVAAGMHFAAVASVVLTHSLNRCGWDQSALRSDFDPAQVRVYR
jgi:Haemolysin-III related